jgi:hypothetical protein
MERFALDALKQYPHKRLLIHFVQPHCPFIGPIGSEWFDNVGLQFWREILTDNIHYTDDKLLAAYVENLEEVIPSVERLIDNLTGRTVVSADHGQVIGEQATPIPIQEYGHPRYSPMDNLVKVPWMFVESEQRREINSETPVEDSVEPENVDVQQHLEALGYI